MSRIRTLSLVPVIGLVCLVALLVAPNAVASGARPQVGQCRATTFAQSAGFSDTRAPIPCSHPHTLQTFAVPNIPAGVDYVHITTAQFVHVAETICTKPFWHALGGTFRSREVSDYSWSFFGPTLTQRKAGARWLRCDVNLVGTTLAGRNYLIPLPFHRFPMLAHPLTEATRRCLGTTYNFWNTPCARAHVARADQTFTIAAAVRPSQSTVSAAAASHCPGKRWTEPRPVAWHLGDHVITCYTVTMH